MGWANLGGKHIEMVASWLKLFSEVVPARKVDCFETTCINLNVLNAIAEKRRYVARYLESI